MSRKTFRIAIALPLLAAIAWAGGKTVTILVKQTSVRSDRQFFAPTISVAKRLDELEVIEEQAGWLKVSHSGKTGWIHQSAVAGGKPAEPGKKEGALSSLFGKEDPAKVSHDEVALAGKGFNEKVESEYKKKNPDLNFAAVDGMEKISVDDKHLAAFVKDGKLEPRAADTGKKKNGGGGEN